LFRPIRACRAALAASHPSTKNIMPVPAFTFSREPKDVGRVLEALS
jgi:hypothetical protein